MLLALLRACLRARDPVFGCLLRRFGLKSWRQRSLTSRLFDAKRPSHAQGPRVLRRPVLKRALRRPKSLCQGAMGMFWSSGNLRWTKAVAKISRKFHELPRKSHYTIRSIIFHYININPLYPLFSIRLHSFSMIFCLPDVVLAQVPSREVLRVVVHIAPRHPYGVRRSKPPSNSRFCQSLMIKAFKK